MNNDTNVNVKINGEDKSKAAVEQAKSNFSGLWKSVAGGVIASKLALEALDKVKEGVSMVMDAAKDWQTQQQQLNAAIASTHGVAGVSQEDAISYAEAISKQTPITRDATLAAENMLLTFTGIHKNVFPQTTQAVADMATRMNGGAIPSLEQMNNTAIMVGKALNDPATGMTKLQRVGVTFTDQQKEQIKTMEKAGNSFGAQKIILDELSKEFGGSAAANADTFQGKITMLKNNMIDWGVNAIPKVENALNKLWDWFVRIGGLADVQNAFKHASQALDDLAAATKASYDWFEKHRKGIDQFISVIIPLIGVVEGLLIAFKVYDAFMKLRVMFEVLRLVTIPSLWATIAANPLLDIAIVLAAVAVEIVMHWNTVKQWFDDFHQWLKAIFKDTADAISAAWEAIKDVATSVFDWFGDRIENVTGFIEKHKKVLTEVAIVIGTIVAPALTALAIKATVAAAKMMVSMVTSAATSGSSWVVASAQAAFAWVTQTLPRIIAGMAKAAVEGTINAIKIGVSFVVQAAAATAAWAVMAARFTATMAVMVAQFLIQAARMAAGWLLALGPIGALVAVAVAAAALIIMNWDAVRRFFTRLAGDIKSAVGNFGTLLYDTGRDLIQGLINGVKSMVNAAGNAVKDVGKDAVKGIKNMLGIHSPSTVFAEIGQNMGQGLIQGLRGIQAEANMNVTQLVTGTGMVNSNGSVPASVSSSTNNNYSSSYGGNVTIQFTGPVYMTNEQEAQNVGNQLARQLLAARAGSF